MIATNNIKSASRITSHSTSLKNRLNRHQDQKHDSRAVDNVIADVHADSVPRRMSYFKPDAMIKTIIGTIDLPDWYSDEVRKQHGKNVVEFFQAKVKKLAHLEVISANIPFGGGIDPSASNAGRGKRK